jgi:hypothetical protein
VSGEAAILSANSRRILATSAARLSSKAVLSHSISATNNIINSRIKNNIVSKNGIRKLSPEN